jgi:uncharacterized protein (DUF2236 family)
MAQTHDFKRRRSPAFPHQPGRYPGMLAAALMTLADGVPSDDPLADEWNHQVGTTRLAAYMQVNRAELRRTLRAHPYLVASWRRRRSRVWRLTSYGKKVAAHLEAGRDLRDFIEKAR